MLQALANDDLMKTVALAVAIAGRKEAGFGKIHPPLFGPQVSMNQIRLHSLVLATTAAPVR